MVPIAPSKTMTWSGSSSRAISGFSGNGRLRFGCSIGRGPANGVVLRFRMVNDDRGCRLFGHELECFRQLHPEGFGCRQQLEDRRVVIEIGTSAVAPRVALAAGNSELLLDLPVCPFRDGLSRLD